MSDQRVEDRLAVVEVEVAVSQGIGRESLRLLQGFRRDINGRMGAIENRMDGLEKRMDALETTMCDLNDKVAGLQSDIAALIELVKEKIP